MNSQQNDSPFGSPKFIISIVLVFILLSGWQYFVNKAYPPKPIVTTQVTTPQPETGSKAAPQALHENTVATSNGAINKQPVDASEEKVFNYKDENVTWQISSLGLGFKNIQLNKYFDRGSDPILYQTQGNDYLFRFVIDNNPINFVVVRTSDTEFIGSAKINDTSITRTIKYIKEKQYFESVTTIDGATSSVGFILSDTKHTNVKTSFLTPSFDRQFFLYEDKESKIKSDDIVALKSDEKFIKNIDTTNLVSIGSQYFVQAAIDKSDISPSAVLQVNSGIVSAGLFYNLNNTPTKKITQKYYIGPKTTNILNEVDTRLPEVMDYGMFGFIAKPLLMLMKFIHQLLGNWGLAIVGLTFVVRLAMLPFSVLSFKSSRAMQKIQPQLQAIREKYKADPMQVNRETMALMKANNANPVSGCLPMLIQIPIFFALWKTIGSSIELYQQPFFGWITDLSAHDPYFVLPVLMGITMFFQQKLTPTTMDPTQAKILNFMPIIFCIFMLSLPSGLTLYNFISALFGVTQQYFLLRDKSVKA